MKNTKKKSLKGYEIPVEWKMYGTVRVMARSLKEAVNLALGPNMGLPDGDYIDESEVVAWGVVQAANTDVHSYHSLFLDEDDLDYLCEQLKKPLDIV